MHLKALTLSLGFLVSGIAAQADPLLPVADGTTWKYAVNDEPGGPSTLTVRIAGTEDFEGRKLLTFETLEGETIKKTELMAADDRGVMCLARTSTEGVMTKLEPPELIVPGALKAGGAFDSDGNVAGVQTRQHFTVAGEENVLVPAGSLRAFRLHCEASSLMSVAIDRWFAPGIGAVKDVITVRGPSGGLLQRTTKELQKRPEVVARPTPTPSPTPSATPTPPPPSPSPSPSATPTETTPTPSPLAASPPPPQPVDGKRLTVEVSTDPDSGMQTEFHSNAEKIYVRWRGHGLATGAHVRVAWIAEDVGDIVEPNFIVDQTETEVPSPDSTARFTLGRPEDGWAEGVYRVEFNIDDQLEETVRVTIVK